MTPEQSIRELHAAIARVVAAGYVVNGELVFCRPLRAGLVESTVIGFIGDNGAAPHRVFVQTAPRRPGSVPERRPVLPNMVPIAPNRETARAMGFTGDICTHCGGSRMRRAGTCLACEDCSATSGCS